MKLTRTRRFAAAAAVFAVVALTASCTSTAAAPQSDSSVVVVGFGGIDTLDPILADQSQSLWPSNALYDPLISYDAAGALLPRLAESWETSPDATQLTFTLRDDVTFSSGNPLTAADVLYTLDRTQQVGTGVASLLADYVSAEAIDDHTVVITLDRPNAIFLGGLSRIFILDSAIMIENEGGDNGQTYLATNAAGTGAYTLTDFRQGADVTLAVRDDYHATEDGRPETIVLRATGDETAGRNALLAGELDLFSMNPTGAAAFAADDEFTVIDKADSGQMYAFLNTQSPELADVRVRQAIAHAFDYEGQIQAMGGNAELATGILPWDVTCRANLTPAEQDADAAAALLSDAGVEDLSIVVQYQTWNDAFVSAATLLQSNLADIGVDVELQTITYETYVASLAAVETTPDVMILSDFTLYPDAGTMLDRTYATRTIGLGSNFGNYTNPKVDELLTAALAESDEPARCGLYNEIEEIVSADTVSLNIASSVSSYIARDGISGYGDSNSIDAIDLRELRVG
ncbi:ABC transporter substrate-binding protein [Microbacterium lacus]|uniref:ABC transporter substrate-binding protein n=1 Tax=Microbacterium lacus TaxID=415217 RepID=UPI00384B21BB